MTPMHEVTTNCRTIKIPIPYFVSHVHSRYEIFTHIYAGRSSRRANIVVLSSHSNVRFHVEGKCDEAVTEDHVNVSSTSSNFLDLRILESLYIFKAWPKQNDNTNGNA